MPEATIPVKHKVGLHARPASLFVQTAAKFSSTIKVKNLSANGNFVDAKSIIMVLTLGVMKDHEIQIQAEGADTLGVGEINLHLVELAERARENKLKLEDVQGGTFTISNLGMFGIRQFRAIINPPESAILAVGSVVRKPVVIDEQDRVEVRPVMSLTLSADHRVIDGIVAARFLSDLVTGLESPSMLLY